MQHTSVLSFQAGHRRGKFVESLQSLFRTDGTTNLTDNYLWHRRRIIVRSKGFMPIKRREELVGRRPCSSDSSVAKACVRRYSQRHN